MELRRIIINREMPQRAATELVIDIYAKTQETRSTSESLHQIFADDVAEHPVIPPRPMDIFKIHLDPLAGLYKYLKDEPATQTKRELWRDMLRGSGYAPADSE